MRAVVFDGVDSVRVADVPDTVVREPGDAVVRVTRTAICGSDLHFFHGKAPVNPGDVLGHEAVGIVEETGPAVTRFRPGERVVVAFDIACGACWYCGRGMSALCEDARMFGGGVFTGSVPGAQAERLLVPAADVNLLAIPGDIDEERALFVGDILTTGFYAASVGGVAPGDIVAVVGAGPLGFFGVQAALSAGASAVYAVDPDPERLALAERMGAIGVNPAERNPQMTISRATGDRGADVVIEAVGKPEAFEAAVDLARPGGTVVVVGVYAGETTEIQLGVYWARGLTIRFTGLCPIHAWWERAMAEVAAGRIDPVPLISHRLPLEEAARGYELFAGHQATKVVLVP